MNRATTTTTSSRTSRGASALLVAAALFASACMPEPRRVPYHFVVPEGFRGEARLQHEAPGAGPLPLVDGALLVEFATDGTAATADARNDGWGADRWFERRASGLHVIEPWSARGLTILNPGVVESTDHTTSPETVRKYQVFEVVDRP